MCFWNIHGLNEHKLSYPVLGKYLKQFNIIFLTETWSEKSKESSKTYISESDALELDGFTYIDISREYRHPNAIRSAGGIGIFIKHELSKGIHIHGNFKDIIAWLKLDKSYFTLEKDLYIGTIYLPPKQSTVIEDDLFSVVQNSIACLPSNSDVLLCGDWNARLGSSPHADIDTRIVEGKDLDLSHLVGINEINDPCNYDFLLKRGILNRSTMDKYMLNNYGKQLYTLCKTTQLMIMNGRMGSDRNIGRFTRVDTTGKSLVDIAIATHKVFDMTIDFEIHSKFPESDHLPVMINLNIANRDQILINQKNNIASVWSPTYKYIWDEDNIKTIPDVLEDTKSMQFYDSYLDALSSHKNTDVLAQTYIDYLTQAYNRIFDIRKVTIKNSKSIWFDSECKLTRNKALKAGERAATCEDQDYLISSCREYRACKQRKKRQYIKGCYDQIECSYNTNRSTLWKSICSMFPGSVHNNTPSIEEFYKHFKQNAIPKMNTSFDYEYEKHAIEFLRKEVPLILNPTEHIEMDILNRNFTPDEIESCIKSLKVKKSPGIDLIPAEFLKINSSKMAEDLSTLYNYIIEERDFPSSWCEGLRNPVHKKGPKIDVTNYRGITVLPILEKIFELAVQRRLEFIDEAFAMSDKYNSGFKKGCRTTDNIFILAGLIERQLILGKSLIVCFVDFSQAFDLVNRHILFYKLKQSGLKGRVIDTLQNLYAKTKFRVKTGGKLSSSIEETIGVNQGGNASPFLFKKYMSDLDKYLNKHTGINIGDELLMHELWADDLYMITDCTKNSQMQLNDLKSFCTPNHMIVNSIKTKCMVFGKIEDVNLYFNDQPIDVVDAYKYLGNLVNEISRIGSDIFRDNAKYLSSQARKAIFTINRKLANLGDVPPKLKVHLYQSMVQPILLYGSDIWGHNCQATKTLDNVFMEFLRRILKVKMTTSNHITIGEFGLIPPSVLSHINTILYCARLQAMPDDAIVKKIFVISRDLHEMGFKTWYSKVYKLAQHYNIDIHQLRFCDELKRHIKTRVKTMYIQKWHVAIRDMDKNPILRLYTEIKDTFRMEPYLIHPIKAKYRQAISKIRASSHTLEVERGRYTTPKTPLHERICAFCGLVEDEKHLIISCHTYDNERYILYNKIRSKQQYFDVLNNEDKFIFLFKCEDPQILSWLGNFIINCFELRIEQLNNLNNVEK